MKKVINNKVYDTAAKLKAEADRQGVSIGELIERLMKEV